MRSARGLPRASADRNTARTLRLLGVRAAYDGPQRALGLLAHDLLLLI
jgi:hypothetical protein